MRVIDLAVAALSLSLKIIGLVAREALKLAALDAMWKCALDTVIVKYMLSIRDQACATR